MAPIRLVRAFIEVAFNHYFRLWVIICFTGPPPQPYFGQQQPQQQQQEGGLFSK